jgi:hypothetical protein
MFSIYGTYYEQLTYGDYSSHLLGGVGMFFTLIVLVVVLRRLVCLYILYKQDNVLLEITPSVHTDKSMLATDQLFNIIHGSGMSRSFGRKLMGLRSTLGLQIVSSKEQGIRYVIRVPLSERLTLEQTLRAYGPDMHIETLIGDLLPRVSPSQSARMLSFIQTGHFAYPLRAQSSLEQHDPIAYMTEVMTQLEPEELMVFQVVLSPAPTRIGRRIIRKLQTGQSLIKLRRRGYSMAIARLFIRLVLLPIRVSLALLMGWLFGYQSSASPLSVRVEHRTQNDQLLLNAMQQKLEQPLYYASVRAYITASSKVRARQRQKSFVSAMSSFRVPKAQALKVQSRLSAKLLSRMQLVQLRYCLPTLVQRRASILSSAEIAGLYHFPNTTGTKTENLARSLNRVLPAPTSLKASPELAIRLGVNSYHGQETDIGLTEQERERHVYIVGGTGNGKTTMLLSGIVQDMEQGKGIAVIDPHGDLAEAVLRYVPESRLNDVVYFNPDDLDYPFGLNLLELPEGLTGTDLLREKDLVTESVISIFRKLFSEDDSGGHRVEYILRNAIQTALTIPDATIFTVYELLNDPTYQKTIVRGLQDKNLRNFWWHELGRAGDYQRVKMAAGVTAKIGRFLFSASARQILEQPRSTIDDILATDKILICNVSKGRLGEDTAALFGTTILARLQIATLRRARLDSRERLPFYVYVDEFQNFATTSFVQLLSEARKYKLFLLMAEQSTSQQAEQRMVEILLANVGTIVCFRSGNPADEALLLPLFRPWLAPGELATLPAHNFYVRLSAIRPQEPLSGHTVVLDSSGSEAIARQVIALSREQYVVPRFVTGVNTTVAVEKDDAPGSVKKPIMVYPVRMSD